MSYPNQDKIKIINDDKILHKENTEDQFIAALNWNPLLDVIMDLNPSEYVLWTYLLKWRGGDKEYDFSPAGIELQTGLSESTTRRIKDRFIRDGYLTLVKKKYYHFDPYPKGVHERAELKRAELALKHSRLSI